MRIQARLLTLAACAISFASSAHATCPALVNGINNKMAEYRSFKATNLSHEKRLLGIASDCKAKGFVVTIKAANVAKALSCEAQSEASALDEEISALGRFCEESFLELRRLQTLLQLRFMTVHNDIEGALKIAKKSRNLKVYCADEVKVATAMSQAFVALETSILDVKTIATSGEGDYIKLKRTGQELAARTKALNGNCGALDTSVAAVSNTKITAAAGAGPAPVIPSGKAARPASDITGTEKAKRDALLAERVVRNQR